MAFSPGHGDNIGALTAAISSRVLLANGAACAVLSGLALVFIGKGTVPGLATGFLIGAASVYWLVRIARRGVSMSPEKAGRFVAVAYQLRFAVVAAAFAILISKGIFSPWPLVAGLTGSIVTTVCTMIYLAKEEASHA